MDGELGRVSSTVIADDGSHPGATVLFKKYESE